MRLTRSAAFMVAAIALVTAACSTDPAPSVSPTVGPATTFASPTPTKSETATPSPSPDPSSPIPSPSPSPSPTAFQSFPPPPPDETKEQAAIREGWEAYNHTLDKFLRDPSLTDLTETQYVTTGEESIRIIDEIAMVREANLHIGGHQLFRSVSVGEVVETEGVRQATVTYCFDPAHQLVFDSGTNEPVPDSGAETFIAHDVLELRPDNTWRVAEHRTEDVRC